MSSNGFFEKAGFVALMAGVGCFLLSFVGMGLAPWTTLKHIRAPVKSPLNPYYDSKGNLTPVGLGRKIYIREGCWHCHSQFVRPVAGEPFRYGPPSKAWESMYDIPQTYGTRRIGPDLSREAGRRSDDWHFAHLYNPRYTVPLSVMPRYPWLFKKENNRIVPTEEGKALVAYLQSLGKFYKKEIQERVYPSYFKVTRAPSKESVDVRRGAVLFKENCVGCHGAKGDGNGKASRFLTPKPANLVKRYISPSEAYAILNRGVLGSSMPSFREMPEKDLWALAFYVSSLGVKTRDKRIAEIKNEPQRITKGIALFSANCAVCHGAKGEGNGVTAAGLHPRPKDFTRRVFELEYFKSIVKEGVAGTAMPPFANLSDEDLENLSAYVTSLFKKER
ncbi:MAG: hypothetical protein D6780_02060 [Candidatus Dadabacteria bacterium]|nr:MAG: hypothetical protein D6780_02060 [Candidatus Dadabacteria bacterium]